MKKYYRGKKTNNPSIMSIEGTNEWKGLFSGLHKIAKRTAVLNYDGKNIPVAKAEGEKRLQNNRYPDC